MVILLTGATGTVGGELARHLLAAGHAVIALVHKNHEVSANDGRHLPAPYMSNKMPVGGQMMRLVGDICRPSLGLNAYYRDFLSGHVDLVIHCAAITAFNAEPEEYDRVNVAGTENLTKLLPAARFLYVSTAYVCGLKNGKISEGPRDPGFAFSNAYEQSKAAAENIVLNSHNDFAIVRPSIIVGTYDDGLIGDFDNFYAIFRMIADGQITQIPSSPDAALNFVPIDHVVGGIMDVISRWEHAMGKTIYLTSDNAVSVQMLVNAIGRFEQLHPPKLVPPSQFSPTALPAFERRINRHIANHYYSYFERHPDFINENLAKIGGRKCPVMDDDALDRLIKYCIMSGFIGSNYHRMSG